MHKDKSHLSTVHYTSV